MMYRRWLTGVLGSILLVLTGQALGGSSRIIPTPQHQTWGEQAIRLGEGSSSARLILMEGASAKVRLAADMIRSEARLVFPQPTFLKGVGRQPSSGGIYLLDWSRDDALRKRAEGIVEEAARHLLSDPARAEQGYVLKVLPDRQQVWLIGGTAQGVLYAAASLLQIMKPTDGGISIPQVTLRDFPDFRYRGASDWLLVAEVNRWAYDWGDGKKAFVERIKRKLDFCLRYKINLVFFDGFGWNSEKFPGYSRMMRELNRYARERGIKLLFGGYGANYNPGAIHPERNIGRVWYNRDQYPHGKVYSCFGENRPGRGTLGTCRGNEELSQLKAAEMADFVRSVEPGALYIHQEDRGIGDPHLDYHLTNYELWKTWEKRCFRCRQKWPSDSLITKDGGAGAVAHGYEVLLRAIRSVKNVDSGYDAARDCTVIFVSPGYNPFPTKPSDWENHLIFWSNVVSLLPQDENLQIGFREIFPQQGTGIRWMDAYQERLSSLGLNTRTFVFFLGGADLYSQNSFNYPFAGTAAMNGIFKGAEAIFNFSGALFQEPLQLFNGEFSWNVDAPGHVIPVGYEEARSTWQSLMNNRDVGVEIVGPGGFLAEAFRQLYGEAAGKKMMRVFNFYKTQSRVEAPAGIGRRIMHTHYDRTVDEVYGSDIDLLVPVAAERLYPLSILWRILTIDQQSGGPELNSRTKELTTLLNIDSGEWQRRWARLWQMYRDTNREAAGLVSEVLETSDLRDDARPDVEYLRKCLEVGAGFATLLATYHQALEASIEEPGQVALARLIARTKDGLRDLESLLDRNFSFDTVDPLGGDQAIWLESLLSIRGRLQELSTGTEE